MSEVSASAPTPPDLVAWLTDALAFSHDAEFLIAAIREFVALPEVQAARVEAANEAEKKAVHDYAGDDNTAMYELGVMAALAAGDAVMFGETP